MATYILVDTLNLGMRVRYGMRSPDMETTVGLAIHVMFNAIKKVWTQFDATTCIFLMEGRSWRKDTYTRYKANRKELAAARTPEQIEEDELFFKGLNAFTDFLKLKTNASVIQHAQAEADDLIARFIHLHPDDTHVIVSTDSDFLQLLAPNVKIYNGIAGTLYTHTGVWDKSGKTALNKRGEPVEVPNPEWLLFEKIMRGDDSDNIMSAYPGVRKKKMQQAFDNRLEQGYTWNNLMLSTWTDHNGDQIRVKDAYERNRSLIDLTAQPEHLKQAFDQAIRDTVNEPVKTQIGFHLLKFANQWGLVRIEQHASDYTACLSSPYMGVLKHAV
jgi:hypothetical protein